MNREQFLRELRRRLKHLTPAAIEEILYDYEEHFSIGLQNGKTEEEIAAALGPPAQIASQYRLEKAIRKAEEAPRIHNLLLAIFIGMGLGFFNLIFVLGIFLALFLFLTALLIAAAVIFSGGFLLALKALFPSLIFWISVSADLSMISGRIATFFAGAGMAALGLLLLICFLKLMSLMYRGTLAYIKANIRIVKKAAA